MSDGALPELPADALREHGTSERVERVWRRLETDVAVSTPRPRVALWWAPAAVVIVFGAGVLVGAHWRGTEPPGPPVAVVAEPPAASEAAGLTRAEPRLAPMAPRTDQPTKPERKPLAVQAGPQPSPDDPVAVVAVPEPVSVPPPAVVPAQPEWERLLANGADYPAVLAAMERNGGFERVRDGATPDQLMRLYEVAKALRQPKRAESALRRVLDLYRGDPNAPVAAYYLGNLLDIAGDKAGAAAAFEEHRRLSPTGDLADDALFREFELAAERKDVERARQIAERYAKDFPKGRKLGAIKKELAKLSGQPASPADGVPEGEEPVEEDTEEVSAPPGS